MSWMFRLGILLCLACLLGMHPAHAQIAFWSDALVFPDDTIQTTAAPGPYSIGGVGPAGGWVFYVTEDGLHGLEAAPVDLVVPPDATAAFWGCYGTDLIGAEEAVIGTGASNTDDIIRDCPWTNPNSAATRAHEYISPSGYFDWYLPSIDELQLMRLNIGQGSVSHPNVGGFSGDFYWSSTEAGPNNAWGSGFAFADNKTALDKTTNRGVRAIRTF